MYCCIMPSVSLNKQDAVKFEELNQNDSGISPSYFSGDSRGSDHMSPVSSSEDCFASTPLNLSDQKMSPLLDHSNLRSHQPVTGLTSLTHPQLSLFSKSLNFSDIQTARLKSPSNSGGLPAHGVDKNGPPQSLLISFNDSSRSLSPASSEDSGDYQNHPLQQLAMVVKRNEMTEPTPSEITDANSEKSLIYCPLCNFSTNSRCTFNAHLLSHEGQKCCYICELTTESFEELRDHYLNVHDVNVSVDFLHNSGSGGEEEPGITVPKVNSQGKIKKHRCKQCGIVCVTKLEFWEHCRGHIKQERLLTCPKCPFVTEYKHHLEYHLRNHFGSKPFKCNKCSYSCVNKSMLNSHLKSHSNVYQFRCNDCSYATKYCHSLKLHLRKYKHSPAMVLNPDGSPNPLPIVDVYGTRRGPKQRPKKPMENIPVKNIAKIAPSIPSQFHPSQTQFPSNSMSFSLNSTSTQFLSTQTQPSSTLASYSPVQTVPSFGQTQYSPNSMKFSPNPSHNQFSSNPTHFSPKPMQSSSNQTQFSPSQARFSPNQVNFSPKQAQLSPNPTSQHPSKSPSLSRSSPQTQLPTNQIQLPSSQSLYSMFPSKYGIFPPTQLSFPYPLVPNSIPFPSLSLLQLDIPALLEEAKRSAETLEKLKQLLQSNNNNSQYISKAVAQQIIDEAGKPPPSPPGSPPPSPDTVENLSTTPLDLSKSTQDEHSYIRRNSAMSPASVICKNRRKGKAVKRVAISSAFGEDSDSEQRSPVHFAPTNVLAGAQRIY